MATSSSTEGEQPASLVRPHLRTGEGVRQRRGAVAVLVMLGTAAAVALLASTGKPQSTSNALAAMTQDDSDHMFRNGKPLSDYPEWSKTIDDINAGGSVNHGEWTPFSGPPFMQRMVLFSGNDVDVTQSGNLVRMVMGLRKNFGKWEGNGFLKSFESQQMRFVQSTRDSVLVVPPLSEGNMVILTDYAKSMIKHFVASGNSMIVCGGPASVDFLNQNFLTLDGSQLLEPAWTRGPYERQAITENTPFQTLAVTLPNSKNQAHGVRTKSLPRDAHSYFETGEGSPGGGVSTVFSLPIAKGTVLFIGYDYKTLSEPWVKTLIAGLEFAGTKSGGDV